MRLKRCEFKLKLKDELKPHKFRRFSKGSKHGNKLPTRMRLEMSEFKLKLKDEIKPHKFKHFSKAQNIEINY